MRGHAGALSSERVNHAGAEGDCIVAGADRHRRARPLERLVKSLGSGADVRIDTLRHRRQVLAVQIAGNVLERTANRRRGLPGLLERERTLVAQAFLVDADNAVRRCRLALSGLPTLEDQLHHIHVKTVGLNDLFAGGDVAFGPRNLIEAVANGKRAALSIDDYLRGFESKPVVKLSVERLSTRSYRMFEGYEKCDRQSPPTISLDRRTGISEVETGYSEEEARRQAERCLYCHIQTIYDPEKCVLCNRCVDVCPEYCLKLVPLAELDLPEVTKEKILENSGIPFGQSLSAMLKDDEKCIRCGLCAIRCPTDAMTMEVFYYEEQEAHA